MKYQLEQDWIGRIISILKVHFNCDYSVNWFKRWCVYQKKIVNWNWQQNTERKVKVTFILLFKQNPFVNMAGFMLEGKEFEHYKPDIIVTIGY